MAARRSLIVVVGLFAFALIPPAVLPGIFVTIDEPYHWFGRAEAFLRALREGDYAATNLVGHPGVTTMWLGALGSLLHRGLAGLGLMPLDDPVLHRALLRLPVGIVTSAAVAGAYVPLRRLVGTTPALLGCLLCAADPFMIAHADLLHTDALVTTVLCGCVAFGLDVVGPPRPLRWGWLVVSGVAAGLAFLTKSPSIILVPMLGLVALVAGWQPWRLDRRNPLPVFLVWGSVAFAIWFGLWPAAWADTGVALRTIYEQARDDGGSPHGWATFSGAALSPTPVRSFTLSPSPCA